MSRDTAGFTVLGALVTLTTAAGVTVAAVGYNTNTAKDEQIATLKADLAETRDALETSEDDLAATESELLAANVQAGLCAEQAEHYWTAAVRMGDAFMDYIDLFPYGNLNLDEATAERDAGDVIPGCYVRTGNE